MVKVPQYITSLTKSDLAEIARATNLVVGRGISITKSQDSVTISIDQNELKRMIWAFNSNGGFSAAYTDLDNISLDI